VAFSTVVAAGVGEAARFCFSLPGATETVDHDGADYHKDEPPVAARQAEVAQDYLKRAARIDELNGHPPGSDGQVVDALKRHNGDRVLVFVMGAFAEMSEDVSCICGIIAHDLARTDVSYYNGDAKRTKGMYRQRTQKAWEHTAHRG